MKIGIVCYPTFGGSGVVATELGKGLAKNGHQVHFITYSQPPRLDFFNENVFYHEVYIPSYPLFQHRPYELALTSKLVEVVSNEGLDLLHVHYAIPHASAAYMAKQILHTKGIDIPFITTLHGTDITLVGKDPSFEPVVTFSIQASDAVTAVSESLRQETYEAFGVSREIEVIPNFIDLNRFQKQKKDHFKLAIAPNGERILLHISNFRSVKRIDDILHMFALLRETLPVKLLLVGDGPERPGLEKMARDLGIAADVRFLGKLDAIEEILSIADVFVMPSEKESFGLAALEAMACEVPVISSDAGGIPEVNTHGQTGFLSPVGDYRDMAEKAALVLQEENLPRFRAAALERAHAFDIANILPRYESLYERVLAAARNN